ncbi:hypothetical protein N5K21_23155 [Rhizobium pusense]|uniref:hypothetical protein n=1 Tax=Agrobacterium pusense TaxID=648995 RepID=UPI00244BBEB2|nr:hypothetical protein [Agrobacterium pusense]MDH2091634.1 hypothetical protein [Agrobacterium pusense]
MRNKVVDSLRRCGRQAAVPLEDVVATLEWNRGIAVSDQIDIKRIVEKFKDLQRIIVQSISVEGASIRETADGLCSTA